MTANDGAEKRIRLYVGIDPGYSGAAVALNRRGRPVHIVRFDQTERDVIDAFEEIAASECFCMLEKVGAMPKDARKAAFKFGQSNGFIRCLLTAYRIPFETVGAGAWQQKMKCRSKGDKNITKAAAQQLFPDTKVIHANADALLIAEYGRRLRLGEM